MKGGYFVVQTQLVKTEHGESGVFLCVQFYSHAVINAHKKDGSNVGSHNTPC